MARPATPPTPRSKFVLLPSPHPVYHMELSIHCNDAVTICSNLHCTAFNYILLHRSPSGKGHTEVKATAPKCRGSSACVALLPAEHDGRGRPRLLVGSQHARRRLRGAPRARRPLREEAAGARPCQQSDTQLARSSDITRFRWGIWIQEEQARRGMGNQSRGGKGGAAAAVSP